MKITCKFKGHLWRLGQDTTPTPNPSTGTYYVHQRCFRCGQYKRELRRAVTFMPKEQ